MKLLYKILTAFFILVFCFGNLAAQETVTGENSSPENLASIVSSMVIYNGKNVTMKLRLKHIDRIFSSITFYDSNNHDITFEISDRKKWEHFAPALLNAHEGMNYSVVFVVKGTGNLGLLMGELVSFEPFILELLP